jgi:hypothetical protein
MMDARNTEQPSNQELVARLRAEIVAICIAGRSNLRALESRSPVDVERITKEIICEAAVSQSQFREKMASVKGRLAVLEIEKEYRSRRAEEWSRVHAAVAGKDDAASAHALEQIAVHRPIATAIEPALARARAECQHLHALDQVVTAKLLRLDAFREAICKRQSEDTPEEMVRWIRVVLAAVTSLGAATERAANSFPFE